MILHGLGVERLVQLMALDRAGDGGDWLLYGPTDERIVRTAQDTPAAEAPEALRWAAE